MCVCRSGKLRPVWVARSIRRSNVEPNPLCVWTSCNWNCVASGNESGGNTAPGVYLREDPICGTQLENQSELRAPTAERAAYYLDAAIAARTIPGTSSTRPHSQTHSCKILGVQK